MELTLNTENVDATGSLDQRTATYYTPWMPRSGGYVAMGVEILAMSEEIDNGSYISQPRLKLTVQTKKGTWTDASGTIGSGTTETMSASGTDYAVFDDPYDLVRLKLEFVDISGSMQTAREMYCVLNMLDSSWLAN